jgi:hypothetical protein
MLVADSNSAKFEFSLHSPQFRIDDGLDDAPEGAADTVLRTADGFVLDPAEAVIALERIGIRDGPQLTFIRFS